MVFVAGEAAEGAGERAAGRRAARRGERMRSRRVTTRTPIEGEIGGTRTETQTFGPRQRQDGLSSGYARQARDVGRNARVVPGGRPSHQGAILAEFIVCILIISLAPIATGGSGTGLSPYSANDLKRMAAIGAVYFGLALVPGDNGSKVAAWLGFLVLIVLLMNSLPQMKSVLDVFSQGGTAPPGATTGTAGN